MANDRGKAPALPDGILKSDLEYPRDYRASDKVPYDQGSFELWHCAAFGWCIPTLRISNARPGWNATPRTYAVTLDGKVVRIGLGPHVTATRTVYVTNARLGPLAKFLELRARGAGDAGAIRDRISSRRAQGVQERAAGRRSWRWDV